jgi:hypothetical protein
MKSTHTQMDHDAMSSRFWITLGRNLKISELAILIKKRNEARVLVISLPLQVGHSIAYVQIGHSEPTVHSIASSAPTYR